MLSPATLTEMCAPVVISDPEAWTAGHGPGIELYRQGERVHAGHGGSMPGYLAHLAVHRPSRTGPVVFAGAYALPGRRIGDLNRHILTTVLDAGPAPRSSHGPRAGAVPPSTNWRGPGGGWGRAWRGTSIPALVHCPLDLKAYRENGCVSGSHDGETMRVRRDAAGRPAELDIATCVYARQP